MTGAPTEEDVVVRTCAELAHQARKVVDAVTGDDSGTIVGGQLTGGHGGLLSRSTIKEVDRLRTLLEAIGA